MNAGAVIVAAGLSSRMGEFKPMMNLGPFSVAQHVIRTFRQAGITKIAVVTGRDAEALTQHLSGWDITFLHNPDYQTTDMFHSAKIGLSHMAAQCSRVLFTPVDIPLFTPHTVKRLLDSNCNLACPVCNGKQGHPLMLSACIIPSILNDSGDGGLKGAIARLGIPMTRVEVNDPGVLRDADTPEDFQRLLDYYHQTLYPSDEQMEQMFSELNTPEQVRQHSDAVAAKAATLAAQVNGEVNSGLLRAACRLHDMAKTHGKAHPMMAAEFLTDKGYPLLADIIAQHHDLSKTPSIEAELLYLADKLVSGTGEVSLEARFSASRQKCRTPDALAQWERRYRDAQNIVQHYQLDP